MKRLFINLAAITLGLIIGASLTFAYADQPDTTATVSEHLYFLENQITVIACWVACLAGAITGYKISANWGSNNVSS